MNNNKLTISQAQAMAVEIAAIVGPNAKGFLKRIVGSF
jgi:hypothetical protein